MEYSKTFKEQGIVENDNMMKKFFNNEQLYGKFVKKLVKDKSVVALQKALFLKTFEDIIESATAIKSEALNLGFTKLANLCSVIIEKAKEKDGAEFDALAKEFTQSIKNISAVIEN